VSDRQQAQDSGSNRLDKVRVLLRALLALDESCVYFGRDSADVADAPDVAEDDPYLLPPTEEDRKRKPGRLDPTEDKKQTDERRRDALIERGATLVVEPEEPWERYARRKAALGPTVPYLERAISAMRDERPDLYARLSSAGDDVLKWLSKKLTGNRIYVPTWARRQQQWQDR
jgi:hypothetical protein